MIYDLLIASKAPENGRVSLNRRVLLVNNGRLFYPGWHRQFGRIYFWTMLSSFSTVMILSIIRWPYNIHLLSIGVLGITATLAGYRLAKKKTLNWTRFHTICMGASYILLMTGFYVDNGKNLPFWKLFPQWFFWVFPAVAGIPIIVFVLRNHSLNKLQS